MVSQSENEQKSVAIKMSQVNKFYGDFHALKNIDLTVDAGERIVICGPSGSGKSTLIRCINGLENHDNGSINVNGIEASTAGQNFDKIRSQVGMVFQQFNLFPHLTVLENLCLAPIWVQRRSYAEVKKQAIELLEKVKIPDQADKYPSQLSGGQQQRVAIARALCARPKIMLFDEPTSALDPEMIQEVLDVMISLASTGMTMLFVTHEMGFARQVADRMVFMETGSIIEIAKTDQFFTSPKSPRSKLFIDAISSH